MQLSHRDYYKIAIPFIISTMTQPLLGAVDTAVIGQLGVAEMIAGVAIGTVIMNTLYWLFGFFRVSTTGQSAMALGQNNQAEMAATLIRPFVLAASVGVVFILLQTLIWQAAMWIIVPEPAVATQAKQYFEVLIWGAPFVLLNYVVIGWLMGQAKVKETLFTQIFGNVLNIILDLIFVLYLEWGITGVAVASLIAQVTTLLIGLYLVIHSADFDFKQYLGFAKMSRADFNVIVSANTDLLLRTVCLLVFFNLFARTGSQLGADFLAANAIMMQTAYIVSYLFDGVANASSVFAGKAVGQKNSALLDEVIKMNFIWTSGFIVLSTLLIVLFDQQMVRVFTDLPQLISIYESHMYWLYLFPIVAGYGLTIYGIFTGTGTTRPVRNSSFMTLAGFLVVLWLAVPAWGNHGLWLAFTSYYVGRFVFLLPFLVQVKAKVVQS